jgi:hypothetical protein
MARYSGCFSLNSLSSAYFKPIGRGIRVERHILCLEWSWMKTVLYKYAAETSGDNTFPYITACTGKHDSV